MSRLLRYIPVRIRWTAALAWACLAVFARWQDLNGHAVPVVVSLLVGFGFAVIVAFGLVRLLRASNASDRPPFDPFSRAWQVFFVITACLLGLPVISVVTDDPDANHVAGAVMFVVGVVLVVVFIRYMRKPVLDYGLTLEEFYAGDRRRRRSATVQYGAAWRVATDPSGVYAVIWVEQTRELCAFRYRRMPGRLRIDPPSPLSTSLLSDAGSVEVIALAEDREVLDRALSGWERYMDQPDGMSWVRDRLQRAAEATARERAGPGRAV